MKVKTTILAPLFLWIGFFPVYADESMAESIIVQQQVKGIRISGTILDKEKSPLPGVNVTVKNEPGGAITDVDGHFYIEVPNKQSVLNITYIGFKSKEIVVGKNGFYIFFFCQGDQLIYSIFIRKQFNIYQVYQAGADGSFYQFFIL